MLQSKEIIQLLEDDFVRSFIEQHKSESVENLALKMPERLNSDRSAILQILQLNNKASIKLPVWEAHHCAFTKRSLEQCSSEAIATARSVLFSGNSAYDLSAGLGVDSWALAKRFMHVTALELDRNLHELALYNLKKLQVHNVTRICSDGVSWLKQAESADLIFMDPDRRDEDGGRHVDLSMLRPNILEHFEWMKTKAKQIYIKLSPLTDPTWLRKNLGDDVSIVAATYRNEVKEIGILWELGNKPLDRVLVVKSTGDFDVLDMQPLVQTSQKRCSLTAGAFLVEPNKAVRILGYQEAYLDKFGISTLENTKFGVHSSPVPASFEGRIFQIREVLPVAWKRLKKKLKEMGVHSGHVLRSNFPEDTKIIRKRLGLPEGDDAFLVFLRIDGANSLAVCQKVN
jgi:16S rRNA G966 N2-methylase RsmD